MDINNIKEKITKLFNHEPPTNLEELFERKIKKIKYKDLPQEVKDSQSLEEIPIRLKEDFKKMYDQSFDFDSLFAIEEPDGSLKIFVIINMVITGIVLIKLFIK